MLFSSLIGESADLAAVAAGNRRVMAPESSEAVARIQQALICLDFELPAAGVDGIFGDETGEAIVAFKTDRGLFPNDPVVGKGTIARLDLEMAYLEGVPLADPPSEDRVLAHDPYAAALVDLRLPDRGIPDKILRFFELSDEFCFPLSLFGPQISSMLGRLVEPKIAQDYCTLQPTCSGDDFFDLKANAQIDYTNFLRGHNPLVPETTIAEVGSSVRPDILRHRSDAQEWYEVKPLSPSGVAEWLLKAKRLRSNYAITFPYQPGRRYRPTREISLGRFSTPEGEHLELFIETTRPALGMLLYRICARGDYVEYFNRVRLIAGMLAILAALAPELLAGVAEAEEVTAFIAMIRTIAAQLGLTLPLLRLVQ